MDNKDTVRAGDTLTRLVASFEEAEQASQDARTEAERARDYYDGRQLTSVQIAALKKRKQPIVIENLIRPKVDYLCGLERQTRTDPKAYPRTATHEDDANSITDALRYAADDTELDIKRSGVFQDMLVEGFGGVEIGVKQTRSGIDPEITHIGWDRLWFDPHSCKPDFSDAMYLGFVTWMDLAKAKRQWPDAAAILDQTMSKGASGGTTETYGDKPKSQVWADSKRRRVRIVTVYDQTEGEWQRGVFTLSGELEPLAPSPYLDEEQKPACALIMQGAYVDRDNDRYGLVRDYMSLQDEVNKRRSKFLHLSNSRQVRVSAASGLSADQVRKEMTAPDGVIIAEQGEVEVIGTGDMAAGHFNLLAEAKEAIKSVGPNATMAGKGSESQSGRAIMAMQQGGMTEVAPILDGLRHFNIRVYRALWDRIRQFWNEERWVRVTDDEKNVRFVGLNTTKGKMAALKIREAMKKGQIDEQQAMMMGQQIAMDPAMQEPANVIAEVDVDIQIDEQMDAPTLQMEQFEQLSQLAGMTPPEFLPTMFEMLIEASSLRNKDKLREIMEQSKQKGPDPMQEQMKQLALMAADLANRKTDSEVRKIDSETVENTADANAKMAGIQIDAMQAGMAA